MVVVFPFFDLHEVDPTNQKEIERFFEGVVYRLTSQQIVGQLCAEASDGLCLRGTRGTPKKVTPRFSKMGEEEARLRLSKAHSSSPLLPKRRKPINKASSQREEEEKENGGSEKKCQSITRKKDSSRGPGGKRAWRFFGWLAAGHAQIEEEEEKEEE